MIVGEETKPSLDELAHYGVIGMKWGQRRKANGTQIRAARKRIEGRQNEYSKQADKVANAKTAGARRTEAAKLKKMRVDHLSNPDRVIATRMTRGEKTVTALLGVLTGPVGIGAAAGTIGATSAVSRRIEKKQDEGAYKKAR